MSNILVVGGGPSGIMSAITAAKNGNEVILIERNGELGRKLRVTGGGRCNFTNYREIEDFFDKVVTNKKFLYSSFYTFTNKDLISFFEENNLEYKVEEDNDFKVYTKNDKSLELIETLNKILINLQGVSLKSVDVMWKVKKKKFHINGDMLFTHFGITGPCILKVSSYINKMLEGSDIELFIDFLPNISNDDLINTIKKYPSRNIVNNLKEILPQNFSKEIVNKLNLSEKKPLELTKAEEQSLIEELKSMKLVCNGTTGLNTAMVTSGGVSVKDIESSTMKSKKLDNLYLIGEVIDVDAETGGYNLQIAFSTGYLAGLNV